LERSSDRQRDGHEPEAIYEGDLLPLPSLALAAYFVLIMPFILLLLLMLAFGKAQAGYPLPDTGTLKDYASAVTEEGFSLKAFNFVQDTLHRPHVTEVRYDIETDRFYWQGPVTGKPMSMDRERFMTKIWSPYSRWCDQHNCD
jgi:hypothetical protein